MIGTILIFIGFVLTFYGTIGLIRGRKLIHRIHFLGVSDTVGSVMIFIGAALNWLQKAPKISVVILITLITGPLVSHAIAKAIFHKEDRL